MKKFATTDLLMFGWEKTKEHRLEVFGAFLLIILFGVASHILNYISLYARYDMPMKILSAFLHFAFAVLILIVSINLIKQGLVIVRGGRAHVRNLFIYPHEFWKYIGGQILSVLFIAAGFLFFIVPGVIIAVRFIFIKTVLVDQGLGPIDSLAKSLDMTRGHTKDLFLFLIMIIVFNIAGLLFIGIGLFLTIPVSFFALLALYDAFLMEGKTPKKKALL